MHIQEPKSLELTKWWPTRAKKKFESHKNHNVLHTYMFCPCVCFPGLQVCLTRCFLLQNAEGNPCNQHFQSERGLYAMFYHTHHIKLTYRVRKALPENFSFVFKSFKNKIIPAWSWFRVQGRSFAGMWQVIYPCWVLGGY